MGLRLAAVKGPATPTPQRSPRFCLLNGLSRAHACRFVGIPGGGFGAAAAGGGFGAAASTGGFGAAPGGFGAAPAGQTCSWRPTFGFMFLRNRSAFPCFTVPAAQPATPCPMTLASPRSVTRRALSRCCVVSARRCQPSWVDLQATITTQSTVLAHLPCPRCTTCRPPPDLRVAFREKATRSSAPHISSSKEVYFMWSFVSMQEEGSGYRPIRRRRLAGSVPPEGVSEVRQRS